MDILKSIILGFIQGTTEWLPISSTGHLRLAEIFFGLSVPLLFDVALHVGTLFVILIYFRRDVKNVLAALWRRDFKSPDGKLIVPIIIGSIPTGVMALWFGNELDSLSNLLFVGGGLIVSGIFLLATHYTKETKSSISPLAAFLIGVMQGLSIVPSISRSGFTIAAALLLGIKKDVAFKFSFLLSIPAIIGALGVTLYQEGSGVLMTSGISTLELVASLAVTVAVSFLALKILWKVLAANKFYLFAIYCFAMGAVLIALSLMGF
jgi:undecaprenyl-diphosphatase